MPARVLLRRALLTGGGLSVALGVAFSAESKDTNSAFVFIKPHANTPAAQKLVAKTLAAHGVAIKSEGELTAAEIDKGMVSFPPRNPPRRVRPPRAPSISARPSPRIQPRARAAYPLQLIDQHYYAIASKATLLKPKDMPVPADKFEKAFGLPWAQALAEGRVFNALDACEALGVDAAGLDALWATAKKTKFGGGFYCGLVSVPGKAPIYVMNGFFMEMRSKFVTPGTSIHYYVVDFDPATLPWADFRAKVLGPTDPKDAPALVLPHNPPPPPAPPRAPL